MLVYCIYENMMFVMVMKSPYIRIYIFVYLQQKRPHFAAFLCLYLQITYARCANGTSFLKGKFCSFFLRSKDVITPAPNAA